MHLDAYLLYILIQISDGHADISLKGEFKIMSVIRHANAILGNRAHDHIG